MEKIRVELEDRSYTITIGSSILRTIGQSLERFDFGRKIGIVSNPTVFGLYGKLLTESLAHSGFECIESILPDGEEYKTLASAEKIYEALLSAKCDRKSAIIALGGGVIGDIAGFVASTYMRGIDFIQVPTTLLAQVDSSVGGKTGVNHALGKNMIGSFWQPRLVWIDISTLHTLSRRDFLSGIAEIIKYGVIWDSDLFDDLERKREFILSLNPGDLTHIISRSCEIKADVVSRDERETGLRAILNFGHTIGHAIETATGYTAFLHGEAIAIGMLVESQIAHLMGCVDAAFVRRFRSLINAYGLPSSLPKGLDIPMVFEAMRLDKKTVSGALRFILPDRIGRVSMHESVPDTVIRQAIDHFLTP